MKISAITSAVCFAALALGASAHGDMTESTPSTVQQASAPTATAAKNATTPAATPAPTTKISTPATTPASTTKATTPATTTKAPTATPATTTKAPTTPTTTPLATNKAATNCIKVSVEGDATYCITGPICSGNGKEPAGKSCPKKGDVAVESCLKTLKSYVDASKCVAPVDAACQAVKTGVWGCVWPTTKTVSVTPASTTKAPTPATTTTTAKKVALASDANSADENNSSTEFFISGGIVVAAAVAVAGTAIYKHNKDAKAQREQDREAVSTPFGF